MSGIDCALSVSTRIAQWVKRLKAGPDAYQPTAMHAGEEARGMKNNEGVYAAADSQQIEGVTRMAECIFESKDIALSWMRRENIALGNAKPIELCDTDEGAAQVRRVLSAIEHGNSV